MKYFYFDFQTAEEINKDIAKRFKNIRRRRKITQSDLSQKSGVSLGSLKRFEQTGDISLLNLTKLAIALQLEEELKELFSKVPYLNLEEIERERNK